MSNVVTENILLIIPVFFTLMIFTLVANNIAINYDNQERLIVIHGEESQLASTIQQLYYTLSNQSIQPSIVTEANPLPSSIDGQPYSVTGNLKGGILTLSFYLNGLSQYDNATFTLGSMAAWDGGVLSSINTNAQIVINKQSSGLLRFSFR